MYSTGNTVNNISTTLYGDRLLLDFYHGDQSMMYINVESLCCFHLKLV